MSGNILLEERIQRLEDIEVIKKLTAMYGLYVNKGWNDEVVDFDKLPTVFAEDATWESTAMNVNVKGRNEIINMLKKATADGSFAMHSFTNPILDVDGDTATGNWLLWVGVNVNGAANQVYQSEDLTYVRTPQGWLIQTIKLHFGQMLNS